MTKTALLTANAVYTENRFKGDSAASDEVSGCLERAQGAVSTGRRHHGGASVFSFRSRVDFSHCSRLRLDADRPCADRYRSASATRQDYVTATLVRACGQPAGKLVHHPGIRRDWSHGGLPLAMADLPDLPPSDRQGRDGVRRLQDAGGYRGLARVADTTAGGSGGGDGSPGLCGYPYCFREIGTTRTCALWFLPTTRDLACSSLGGVAYPNHLGEFTRVGIDCQENRQLSRCSSVPRCVQSPVATGYYAKEC